MTLAGGPVFWIMVVMAVIAVIAYFERLVGLRRAQVDYLDLLKGVVNVLDSGNDDEALAICDDVSAPAAQIVATAIRHRSDTVEMLRDAVDSQGRAEIGRLDRRLAVLAIIGQVSPLLGLLGSLIGFVKAVMVANAKEVVVAADLTAGVMEALISAVIGIAVAIMVTMMYGSLRVRLDRLVIDLEAVASQIVAYLTTHADRRADK